MVCVVFFFLRRRRPPRSTQSRSSAASDVYKRQGILRARGAEYFFTSPVFVRVLQQTYNLRYLMDKVKEEGL